MMFSSVKVDDHIWTLIWIFWSSFQLKINLIFLNVDPELIKLSTQNQFFWFKFWLSSEFYARVIESKSIFLIQVLTLKRIFWSWFQFWNEFSDQALSSKLNFVIQISIELSTEHLLIWTMFQLSSKLSDPDFSFEIIFFDRDFDWRSNFSIQVSFPKQIF